MFLHFNMRRFKCLRYSDTGNVAEYYFTWRTYVDGPKEIQLAQGFNLGCPADDGYDMTVGQERALNDPKFTVELPNVAEGETKHVVLDLFAWESDRNSLDVKKTFTNEAATKLLQIAEQAKSKREEVIKQFTGWLSSSDNEVVNALVETGVATASSINPYVAVAKAAIKLLTWIVELLRTNADDFLGAARAEIIYTRLNGKLMYRWIFDNGVESWFDEEQPVIHQAWRVLEADQGNELDCRFLVQIISASPTELKAMAAKLLKPDAVSSPFAGSV